ncbi:hypothetical protein BC938DRAFT_474026 [Jimgerdemannia flammicorona]|uniref:Major facilitator superfamily (MFS) profile domain-containing protein n=1 Tax=Jimgerdemannia flammicorona TaxID=994334 RepID=A0A433Q2V9_9FUNG|nr:hypothetical protein BC938DRAFT_474026 [Jimgerdemannia flammicorona]
MNRYIYAGGFASATKSSRWCPSYFLSKVSRLPQNRFRCACVATIHRLLRHHDCQCQRPLLQHRLSIATWRFPWRRHTILPSDLFGRKCTIVGSGWIFIIGAILQTSAVGVAQLFVGRAVSGFCLAIFGINISMYNAEIAPPQTGGGLVCNIQRQLLPLSHSSPAQKPEMAYPQGSQRGSPYNIAKIRQTDINDSEIAEEWKLIEDFVNSSWSAVFQPQNVPRLLINWFASDFLPASSVVTMHIVVALVCSFEKPSSIHTRHSQFAGIPTTDQLLRPQSIQPSRHPREERRVARHGSGRRTLLLSGTLVHFNTSTTLGPGAYIAIIFIYIYMIEYAYSWRIIHYVLSLRKHLSFVFAQGFW